MTSYHTFKASGQNFEIDSKYSLIRPIGHGAYGVVISALDKDTNQKVAIKKVSKAFEDAVDAKRILREIRLMKKFVHENVVRILDIVPPPPTATAFDDIYIVQDLMETDLHRIIYSRQSLSIEHIQYFIYQLLRGLKYIHSSNVIHRDLKPSNLLLNSNCDLKICDFGLARLISDEDETQTSPTSGGGPLTEYVVTRWYRAPEIMLACQEYTKAIDVWSVGCIFAELLARTPLFPGEDYIAQLTLICDKLGKPKESDLDFVTSERAKRFMLNLPNKPAVPMGDMFPAYRGERSALSLLSKLLEFHPERRITTEQALNHPFLESLHKPEDEPVADFHFSFEFENEEMPQDRVREYLWEEIRDYHPEIARINPTSEHKPATRRNSSTSSSSSSSSSSKSDSKSSEIDDHSSTSSSSSSSSSSHHHHSDAKESKNEEDRKR